MLIDIISPAGAHLDLAAFDRACDHLRQRGHVLNIRAPREGWQRFGGDDATRLAMIHEAASGAAEVVMLTRGGYGVSRLLDRIDWPLVARAVNRGQRWIGYSDFTAFQAALFAQTGARSFAGPTVSADFSAQPLNVLMQASFEALLRGVTSMVQWQLPDGALAPVSAGHCRGPLWGGNLSMLCSVVGTPYLPTFEAPGLLWIEDVSEHPYRVERMLHQLFHAGVLARQKALIFGSFNQWKPASHDNGYGWEAMMRYWRERLRNALGDAAPVLLEGLPFGHQPDKVVLEFGRPYRLSWQATEISLIPD